MRLRQSRTCAFEYTTPEGSQAVCPNYLTPEAAQEDSKAVHSRYTIRGKANVREVGRVEAQIYYGAAKPECSNAELQIIHNKSGRLGTLAEFSRSG